MSLSYEQGETIAFFVEGKTPEGVFMEDADRDGLTCRAYLQKAKTRGRPLPDNNTPKIAMTITEVAKTDDNGAGWMATYSAANSLNLDPALYIYEREVVHVSGDIAKAHEQIQMNASIK